MRFWLAAGILAVSAAWGAWQVAPMLRLAAAFYAKTLCSGVFVAGLRPKRVIAEDVLAGMSGGLKAFRAQMDRGSGEVRVSLHGFFEHVALHRPGLGCTLANGTTTEALRAQASGLPMARPGLDPDLPWPLGRKVSTRDVTAGLDRAGLEGIVDDAFLEPDPQAPRRTRAVVIVHEGRIVAERYAHGIGVETPLSGWSMAKSAVNALVGILVGEGRLTLDRSKLRPAWAESDDPRGQITVFHLLRMTSGLAFDPPDKGIVNDVRRMLYLSGDSAAFAVAKPAVADAGGRWFYASGSTSILCRVVADAAAGRGGHPLAFARKALFDRIGMTSAVFERDAAGTLVGPAFLHASARDWARLGLLYLQDGLWAGARILPEGWVRASTQATMGSDGSYGAHLWRRIPDFLRPVGAARRRLPEDAFYMLGRDGQMVAIVPSRALVAVRLGLSRDRKAWDPEAFLASLLGAVFETRSHGPGGGVGSL